MGDHMKQRVSTLVASWKDRMLTAFDQPVCTVNRDFVTTCKSMLTADKQHFHHRLLFVVK